MSRDLWMHRYDIATATGRPFILDGHDSEVVRQVVHDLADAWSAPPVILHLTGPAGGCWSIGNSAPTATVGIDAIAYLRLLSGRPTEAAPTVDGDPHAATALLAARIEF